jgi:hypothetical protein
MSPDVGADDVLISLDEAAKLIPGADAGTLKRHARAGRLTVYRPGKAYVTTRGAVKRLIQLCLVSPKVSGSGSVKPGTMKPGSSPTSLLGLSSTDLGRAALDSVLMQAKMKRPKRFADT